MNTIIASVLSVALLLASISIVVPISRRLRLPYTLVLAGMGVVIGLCGYLKLGSASMGGEIIDGFRRIGLLDDAFIYIYLPPLLFAAGLTVNIRSVLEDIWHVILLALIAVVACTVFVGLGLNLFTGLGLLPCLLFGAIVSTTDTAAVVNIFREVGAPKRLLAIVEGEALFNDAAAIALFSLFLGMLTTSSKLDIAAAGRDFLIALLGGAAFGYAMGRACGWLISFLKDAVTTEVTLTIGLAYLTFVFANDALKVSGVVATVTLAMVIGADSRTRVSPGSWETLNSVWEHLDFWATSLIFVTSAMYVPRALGEFSWGDLINVVVVFVAALASRAVVIWGMMPTFSALGASKPLNNAYRGVLWWGGMRGAVTVALALATAATDGVSEPIRHLVVSTAIGYVIASLVLNGLSLRPLMGLLRLDKLTKQDRTLRRRILLLARRRIRKELREVAAAIGHDVEALSAEVLPIEHESLPPTSQAERLLMALDTWCHHEIDMVLSFRERGLLTRQHADSLRGHADRLINALNLGGVEGYLHEAERLRHPPITLRLGFWAQHRLGWRAPLASTIANRMEHLVGELLLLRELIGQCATDARRLFGVSLAAQLKALLTDRAEAVDAEIKAIEATYAHFAQAMHRRHLALVALGLVEAEYRRHLTSATISTDIFEDLDSERRTIAARFSMRPGADFATDLKEARREIMRRLDDGRARPCFRSFLTYPGQLLRLPRVRSGRVFYLGSGEVDITSDGQARRLAPGAMFSATEAAPGCIAAQTATSLSYCNVLEVDVARLTALGFAAPSVIARLTPRRPPARLQLQPSGEAAPAESPEAPIKARRRKPRAEKTAQAETDVTVRRRGARPVTPADSQTPAKPPRRRARAADASDTARDRKLAAAE